MPRDHLGLERLSRDVRDRDYKPGTTAIYTDEGMSINHTVLPGLPFTAVPGEDSGSGLGLCGY